MAAARARWRPAPNLVTPRCSTWKPSRRGSKLRGTAAILGSRGHRGRPSPVVGTPGTAEAPQPRRRRRRRCGGAAPAEASQGAGCASILMVSRFLRAPAQWARCRPARARWRIMVSRIPTDQRCPSSNSVERLVHARHCEPRGAGSHPGDRAEQTFVDRVRQKLPSVDVVRASTVDLGGSSPPPQAHRSHRLSLFASLPMNMTRKILDGIEHVLRQRHVHDVPILHGHGGGRTFRRQMNRGWADRRSAAGRENFPLASS